MQTNSQVWVFWVEELFLRVWVLVVRWGLFWVSPVLSSEGEGPELRRRQVPSLLGQVRLRVFQVVLLRLACLRFVP